MGELYKPKVALLPIGGHFTMGPREARRGLLSSIEPEVAIPMRYGTFPRAVGHPQRSSGRLVEGKGLRARVVLLKPGERFELQREQHKEG